jgi:hypothetical protein
MLNAPAMLRAGSARRLAVLAACRKWEGLGHKVKE